MNYENNCFDGKMSSLATTFDEFQNGINSDCDKNLLTFGKGRISYNYIYDDGVLKDGIGVSNLKFRYSKYSKSNYKSILSPESGVYLMGCWHFKVWDGAVKQYDNYLIFYASNGKFYYNSLHSQSSQLTEIAGLTFSEKPSFVYSCRIGNSDTLIIALKTDGMYSWQYPNIVSKIKSEPNVKSMCIVDGKLFATTHGDGRSIVFSDSMDLAGFNSYAFGGGEICMPDDHFGKCNKVVAFNGYLYIFRDFNIAKLTTYASKNDYSLSQLYVSNGLIFENTIAVCGDKILYLASDGIYSFDGSCAKRLELGITNLFKDMDNFSSVAVYCDGYYYLSCTLNFDDDVLGDNSHAYSNCNNALLRIDVCTNNMTILRGCDIKDISVINDDVKSEVCVLANVNGVVQLGVLDESGKIFENNTLKVWKSSLSHFDLPNKNKVVKEIWLETHKDITIDIICDGKTKSFKIKGKDGYQSIKPRVCGKSIGINFKSLSTDNYISRPKIIVGYV